MLMPFIAWKNDKTSIQDSSFLTKKNKYESNSLINNFLKNYLKFLIWLEINLNINTINKFEIIENRDNIRKNIMKCQEILIVNEILEKSISWSKNKSLIFLTPKIRLKNFVFLELYNKEFSIYRKRNYLLYMYGENFLEVFEIFKSNPFSKKKFETDFRSEFIHNLTKIKAKIDYDLLTFFYKKKIKLMGIVEEDVEDNYAKINIKLIQAIKDDDKKNLQDLSTQMSLYYNLLRIKKILEIKRESYFYFPASICFRGRTYYASSVSFTLYKEFRYCLIGEPYEENFIQPFHPLNFKIEKILEKNLYNIWKIKNFDFRKCSKNDKISLIWVLISIAEIDKKNLGREVQIEDFLNHAIKILNQETILTNLDEYDELKLESLKLCVKEISENKRIRRLIAKDATASCFQHLIKILGAQSKEAIKWCNLNSESSWYDTYMFVLDKWKKKEIEKNPEDEEFINKYFTRKTIKKTTMTVQYGAGFKTCLEYALSEISDTRINETKILLKFKKYLKSFYNFTSEDIGLLKNSSFTILEELRNLKYTIEIDEQNTYKSIAHLEYNQYGTKQISTTWKKKRLTKNKFILSNTLDAQKIKTSIRANYIHVQDSAVIRYVIAKKPIITVHDCFLIDYKSITFLIALVNDAMRKDYHGIRKNNINFSEIFSIFIII